MSEISEKGNGEVERLTGHLRMCDCADARVLAAQCRGSAKSAGDLMRTIDSLEEKNEMLIEKIKNLYRVINSMGKP